jgi:cytochrome c
MTEPDRMVPGNEMPFNGIKDSRARADLLAFLKEATKPGAVPEKSAQAQMKGMGGGMMGGMMSGGERDPSLKKLALDQRVNTITYCHDTYRVTTGDGKTRAFWNATCVSGRIPVKLDRKKVLPRLCPQA